MGIIKNCKRIVIKIGTSTLTYQSGALNLRRIELLTRAVSDFKNAGHEVVMVSSGAVGAGFLCRTLYADLLRGSLQVCNGKL